LPQFVSCYAQIYNRKGYIGLKIIEKMVGHKFGEFASIFINYLDFVYFINMRSSIGTCDLLLESKGTFVKSYKKNRRVFMVLLIFTTP